MKQYSYSKVSTYSSCPLSYELTYLKHIKVPKRFSYDLAKGLVLHAYSEVYAGDSRYALEWAFKKASQELPEISSLSFDEHQAIINGCKTTHWLYETFFSPYLSSMKKEFKIFQTWDMLYPLETSTISSWAPKVFSGVLDVFINLPESPIILDYKTPSSTDTSAYKSQLFVYAYFLSKMYQYPLDAFQIYVYFPFARKVATDEQRLKKIPSSKTIILKEIEHFVQTIEEIESCKVFPPKLGWFCSYCAYAGYEQYCPLSVRMGAPKKEIISPQEF